MSLDVTFDKEKKYLTFTFKNNDKNLELFSAFSNE